MTAIEAATRTRLLHLRRLQNGYTYELGTIVSAANRPELTDRILILDAAADSEGHANVHGVGWRTAVADGQVLYSIYVPIEFLDK